MDIIEIRNKINAYYGIDMTDGNQSKPNSNAKKVFVFICRSRKYNGTGSKIVYRVIGSVLNIKHETCIYHNKIALQWFSAGDTAFRRDLFLIFGIKEKKPKEIIRLGKIREVYDDLLLSVPDGMHEEIIKTIKLKVQASKWKKDVKNK
jgi:hypothetical protein